MVHKFVVNTENVNAAGYRVITSGIDYTQYLRNPVVLFMHTRAGGTTGGKAVVGRCIDLAVEGTALIAAVEFDEADEYAKEVAGKVERGFIRMASMHADVIATSADAALLLPGQVYETVTRCKLVEISIVDIGANDDALKLSKGNRLKLRKVKPKKEALPKLDRIALALGLAEAATEDTVAAEVQKIKQERGRAEAKVTALTNELKQIKEAEAAALVDEAIQLSLIPEALKTAILAAFDAGHDGQKVILANLIHNKRAENAQNSTHEAIRQVVLGKGAGTYGKGGAELSFDYLQKHDQKELKRICDEEPARYAQLAREYGAGKRYTETK